MEPKKQKPLKRMRQWQEDKVVAVRMKGALLDAMSEITEDEGINVTTFLTRAAVTEVERIKGKGYLDPV